MHMRIDDMLSGLPVGSPKPCLLDGDGEMWAQDNLAITFNDFNLRAGLIQPKPSPQLGRQRNGPTLLHRYEHRYRRRSSSNAAMPHYRYTAFDQS